MSNIHPFYRFWLIIDRLSEHLKPALNDYEIETIGILIKRFDKLQSDARQRIVDYLCAKYQILPETLVHSPRYFEKTPLTLKKKVKK